MNTYNLIPRVLGYRIQHSLGCLKTLPVNLTLGLTYRCNSRCGTCRVYEKGEVDELSLEEYSRVFQSIGENVYWVTLSGGEPSLREDLTEVCTSLYQHCKPNIINLPTNGILTERIVNAVDNITKNCPNSKIIINLSLDGVGGKHDRIRGVKGNFERVVDTYHMLRKLDKKNLELGVHTVISKLNIQDIPETVDYVVDELKPDSYVTEVAENREELGTTDLNITPTLDEYSKAIDYVTNKTRKLNCRGTSKITQAFRLEYYDHVKRVLANEKAIPCYAGIASCQITPDGKVWTCCMKAEERGDLRDVDYDFKGVWNSKKADATRKEIKNRKCSCPLANTYYTNALTHTPTLIKVLWRILG